MCWAVFDGSDKLLNQDFDQLPSFVKEADAINSEMEKDVYVSMSEKLKGWAVKVNEQVRTDAVVIICILYTSSVVATLPHSNSSLRSSCRLLAVRLPQGLPDEEAGLQ